MPESRPARSEPPRAKRRRESGTWSPPWVHDACVTRHPRPVQPQWRQKGGAAAGGPGGGKSVACRSSLRRRHTGAERTAHAGSAKPAIAGRVLGEVLLMIILGEVEWRRVDNLGR